MQNIYNNSEARLKQIVKKVKEFDLNKMVNPSRNTPSKMLLNTYDTTFKGL